MRNFNPRSPDGERPTRWPTPNSNRYFNPRSPDGERPPNSTCWMRSKHFNPRSPDGERHQRHFTVHSGGVISIHAPRMGSDGSGNAVGCRYPNFNPRSPDGERLWCAVFGIRFTLFQSTLPGWGATDGKNVHRPYQAFQSTLPGWGATGLSSFRRTSSIYFNPRSPDGERPAVLQRDGLVDHISIHAPRMGSDHCSSSSNC